MKVKKYFFTILLCVFAIPWFSSCMKVEDILALMDSIENRYGETYADIENYVGTWKATNVKIPGFGNLTGDNRVTFSEDGSVTIRFKYTWEAVNYKEQKCSGRWTLSGNNIITTAEFPYNIYSADGSTVCVILHYGGQLITYENITIISDNEIIMNGLYYKKIN